MFTNLNLTDMEVCYKVFRKSVLDRIDIKCNRFGFEPEITAKIAKLRPRLRIYEVGVAYYGRSYEEGKKITWNDGDQGDPDDHAVSVCDRDSSQWSVVSCQCSELARPSLTTDN